MLIFFAMMTVFVAAGAQGAETAGYMQSNFIADPTLWSRFVSAAPDWLVALVPMLVSIMVAARGLSEFLLVIAQKTETKADDKVVGYLGRGINVLAKVLGQIGVGMPKKMVEEKAKKIEEKKVKSEG